MASKKKVLIIDDDSRNIFALSAVLKARGFHCISASGTMEGIDLLNNDMTLEMDGYEAMDQIKSDEKIAGIPIIAVTAQAMVGDREKTLAAGADNYASKPIDVDFLTDILNEHLT